MTDGTRIRPIEPPGRKRASTLLVVGAGAVILGLLAGAVALFVLLGAETTRVADLDPGDCVRSPAIAEHSTQVEDLEVVSCDRAHHAEVVATGSVADTGAAADACIQLVTDAGSSVAALSVEGQEVRPLYADGAVACLVVGDDLVGSVR